MPELNLTKLQNDLLRAGVSPRHVRRTVNELSDHYEDLVDNALADGAAAGDAQRRAQDEIGDMREVALAMRANPDFRSWAFRYPYLALLVYPLTCIVLLPAVPVMAGVAHAGFLARWAACIIISGFVTASIFLMLQLSILLT